MTRRSAKFNSSGTGAGGVDAELAAVREQLRRAGMELRQQNEELAVSRELIELERHRYQELFDLAPDAYFITDADGLVRECNVAAATLLGVTREFVVAKPLPSFIDVEARREFRVQLENLKREDRPRQWRSELRARSGAPVPIAISAAPIRQGRSVRGLRWLIRDDSAQNAAQARLLQLSEELASRAVEQRMPDSDNREPDAVEARGRRRASADNSNSYADLLDIVSHEIRTPLAAAHGYVELLSGGLYGELTATQGSHVESIARCHEHMLRVLDNALAAARLDGGHLELALAPIAVDSVLARLRAFIQLDVQARRIRYEYRAGDPQVAVLADRGRLHQILLNLLTNAVKYTPAGGEIVLSWHATNAHVRVSVQDTGIGIAPEHLARIFEPYVRLGDSDRAEPGDGLGLSISQKLARAMGATITAVSAPGVGSTFTLVLPRAHHDPR